MQRFLSVVSAKLRLCLKTGTYFRPVNLTINCTPVIIFEVDTFYAGRFPFRHAGYRGRN
jgi:hypothetical protein